MLKKKYLITIFAILGGIGVILLSNFRTANTQSSDKASANKTEEKTAEGIPIVSLIPKTASKIDKKREKRNAKFDKSDWVKKIAHEDVTAVKRITHWQVNLPALPTKKSDSIVIGTVTSSEAFISNDETGIYSEFSVKVSDILKNNQNSLIESNTNIDVQRAGGGVIYPNGKVLTYLVHGQSLPKIGSKYVFFLIYNQETQTYSILTAYEISKGEITALDGQGTNKGSGFEFTKYNRFSEQQFMQELQTALYSQTDSTKEVVFP